MATLTKKISVLLHMRAYSEFEQVLERQSTATVGIERELEREGCSLRV